jgi:hypothetical protein
MNQTDINQVEVIQIKAKKGRIRVGTIILTIIALFFLLLIAFIVHLILNPYVIPEAETGVIFCEADEYLYVEIAGKLYRAPDNVDSQNIGKWELLNTYCVSGGLCTDGKYLYYSSGNTLRRCNLDGSHDKRIYYEKIPHYARKQRDCSIGGPIVYKDGYLYFVRTIYHSDSQDICLKRVKVTGWGAEELYSKQSIYSDHTIEFCIDGDRIYFTYQHLYSCDLDGDNISLVTEGRGGEIKRPISYGKSLCYNEQSRIPDSTYSSLIAVCSIDGDSYGEYPFPIKSQERFVVDDDGILYTISNGKLIATNFLNGERTGSWDCQTSGWLFKGNPADNGSARIFIIGRGGVELLSNGKIKKIADLPGYIPNYFLPVVTDNIE